MLPIEERTLPKVLARRAAEHGDRTFLFDAEGSVTWAEAFEHARRVAGGLARLGVERGDSVGIIGGNRREFLWSWFGVNCLGAVEVPVNPTERAEGMRYPLHHSGARVVIVEDVALAEFEAAAENLPGVEVVVVMGEGATAKFRCLSFAELVDGPPADPADLSPSDPAAVLYTSGSTGPPKGVVVSHGHHATNGLKPAELMDIGPDDILYICLPLNHNMAQGYGFWPALVSGAAVRLAPRFSVSGFWPDVRESGATVLPFVGVMLVLLAKEEPSTTDRSHHLRVGYGVPIPKDIHEAFEERFGLELVHCYGSTEATIVSWNTGPDRVVGSVGKVLDDYRVRIVDELDRPVATGEVGEICVRPESPWSMFSGYLHDAPRAVHAWRNLWFHTGDRGRLDEDGYLYFVDRLGDTIRRRGEMISAYDVEQVLLAHPAVKLAAVYAVPSELIEDEVMASVVCREGHALDAAELRAFCTGRMVAYAIPRYVEFMDELPLTATGKIEKYKLAARGVTPATDDALATTP